MRGNPLKVCMTVAGMVVCTMLVVAQIQPGAAILAFTSLAVYAILSGMP